MSVHDFLNDDSNQNVGHKPKLNTEDWLEGVSDEVLGIVDSESKGKYHFVPSQNRVNNLEHFVLYIKQLGRGSSCRVILAEHKQSKVLFALKQLRKDDYANMARFENEVKILSQLQHNNIVKFVDAYVDTFNFYIATQYCHSPFLDHILKQKQFSERQAANYLQTILEAIEYMHNKNIVHRDLKV